MKISFTKSKLRRIYTAYRRRRAAVPLLRIVRLLDLLGIAHLEAVQFIVDLHLVYVLVALLLPQVVRQPPGDHFLKRFLTSGIGYHLPIIDDSRCE